MSEPLLPTRFVRNKTHLHALLVENQAWFCVHEMGRLMGKYLDERQLRKLDSDQRQMMRVETYGEAGEHLMVSESGVYALLIHHYCPEYRQLREWVTH
jgi:prophage antirepressor-like protein